jgi:hypothetical protein
MLQMKVAALAGLVLGAGHHVAALAYQRSLREGEAIAVFVLLDDLVRPRRGSRTTWCPCGVGVLRATRTTA